MKGTFNQTMSADNNVLNFGLVHAIAAIAGLVVNFKFVSNWERIKSDGTPSGKVYNALMPVKEDGTTPLIAGFALTKWDLNPTPRISRDANGKLIQLPVTGNLLYATAAAEMREGITEADWLRNIATKLNGKRVKPFEYIAVKKDGGTYNNVIFGVE